MLKEELETVLDYVLNSSCVPKKALKRTKRLKIGLFGKTQNSYVEIDNEEVSIKIYNTPDQNNISMELFHSIHFERNQFKVKINKTLEMEELSLFAERDHRLFDIIVFNDKIKIESEDAVLEI